MLSFYALINHATWHPFNHHPVNASRSTNLWENKMTKCKLMKGLLGTFTLNYDVNNTPQTEINNTGTPTVFNVDRLVNVTVSNPGNTFVVADQDDALLPFVVVNNGNDTHAYLLGFEQAGGDDFNTAAATTAPDIIFYEESDDTNGDGVLSEAERAAGTPQSYNTTPGSVNLPVLGADDRVFVYVRQNIPAGLADADEGGILLYADTQTITGGTGATLVYTETMGDGDGNDANPLTVENVLADADGPATTNDAATDGAHSALGNYIVEVPNVTATKEVFGLAAASPGTCDAIPASYTKPTASTEYHTPNSCVEYVIEVDNSGTTNATNIDLTDILPDHLTFREAEVRGDLVFLPADLTTPAAATECDGTATCTVALVDATLDAGESGYLVIRATID